MNSSDVDSLRRAHGDSVSRYLTFTDSNKIQKTVSGAFLISSRDCFDKCRQLVTNETGSASKQNSKHASEEITSVQTTRKRRMPMAEHENYRKRKWMLASDTTQLPAGKSKNGAELVESFTNLSVANETKNYSLQTEENPSGAALVFLHSTNKNFKHRYNGKQLYELMIKTNIGGSQTNVDYKACLEDIGLILTKFQSGHANYPYYEILQGILKGGWKIPKNQFVVTLKQYRLFVFKVILNVIPKDLFGCNKNVKILRKAVSRWYVLPYGTHLDLKKSICRLDISRIPWLQKIKKEKTQWSVIAKVTKWLFENFFMRLFKAVFRDRKCLYSDKRIIVSAVMWKNVLNNYINREVSKGRVTKVPEVPKTPEDECRMTDIQYGKMILHPKSLGVRPIYQLRCTQYQKKELDLLKTLLQQLYRQKYDDMNYTKLHATWLSYAKANEENINRKVNVVTCDVADAFGSILLKKLFDIVNSMIDQVPYENLPIQCYEILRPKLKDGRQITEFKRWFSCWPETFNARYLSLIAMSKKLGDEVLYVKKEYVRTKLAANIFEQVFVHKGQKYTLRKGIMQGSPLSPILSDIYYQEMMVQEFGIFMQSGTLLRYVDDYIYMTMDEVSAKRFLKAIRNFVPKYNCRFKKSKIQTNVQSQLRNTTEWVDYLGLELNGQTMEVRPKYEKPEFEYLQCMKKVARRNSLPILKTLFKNMICLKLNPIVLDPRINSPSRLCSSARLAAKLLATRCAIFIKTIFSDPTKDENGILQNIQHVAKRLESSFCQYLTASDRAKWPNFQRDIKTAIWQSFFRVFMRYREWRASFCQYMKIMMRNKTLSSIHCI